MIKNPFEEIAPDDRSLWVHAFARDFAWGVVYKGWEARFDSFWTHYLMDKAKRNSLMYTQVHGKQTISTDRRRNTAY